MVSNMTQTSTIPEKKTYTYKDYAQLPEGAPYELINGQLVEEPSPSSLHQDIAFTLSGMLYDFLKSKKCGKAFAAPLDVYFEEKETFQPDLIFISNKRLNIVKEQNIEGAPDIIFEILSPATAYYDLRHKKDIYAKHGVKEYWIIDPMEKSIEVYEQKDSEFELHSKQINSGKVNSQVLSTFTFTLEEIF